MGLFTFFDRFRGSGSSNASGGDRSPWGDFSFESISARTGSGMRVSPDSALRLAAVYACVRILAETIASLPLVVYQRRPDGGKDRVTDHWLYRLMAKRPNRFQNPFEWREMLQGHLALRGNAFNQIITNPRGEIIELMPKRFEGFCRVPKSDPGRAYPYICPAGFWTIGYGHLCDAKHLPITKEEGEAYLAADMADALRATLRYCPVLATEPEGRLAAIVDFTFNLGAGRLQASTLRRRVNQRDWLGVAQELRSWIYGGGKVLPGLVLRREAEVSLLF